MSRYLILSFICLFFAACSRLKTIEVRNGDGKLVEQYQEDSKTHVRDGWAKKYFENGKLAEESLYLDDTLHAQRKIYSDSGWLEIIETYKFGTLQGPWLAYYPNGKLKQAATYVNGQAEGEWLDYYDTGQLKAKSVMAQSSENGPFEEYFMNGKVSFRGTYKDGKENGKLEVFNETGILIKQMQCDTGICHTTWQLPESENIK